MALNANPFTRLTRLLRVDKRQITHIYLYAIFSGVIYLSIPLGIQAIINFLSGGQISTSLVLLIVFVIVGVALSGWFQILQLSLTENLQQRIFTRASFEFAYRIPRIKLEALYKHYAPELMNRFFDTLSVQKGLAKLLIDFSTATLQVVFGLMLLSFYHPFFILFGLITVLAIYLIFRFTGPQGLQTSLKESQSKYEVAHWLEEVARTLNTFKLAGNTNLPVDKTDELVQDYLKHRKSHFRILVLQFFNMIGFKVFIVAGLLILGSYLVINEQINIGQFVASEIIIILIISSIEKLILNMDTVYDVLTALEKMGTVTDLPLDGNEGMDLINRESQGGMKVNLQDVSFTFPGASRPVIKNINLTIQPGERICISGYNSSGKTTLLQLMAGLYERFEGNILYNDISIGNLNLDNLRKHIGDSLFQEKLFKGSLLENITLGRKEITMECIQWAIDITGLQSFINENKDGFHMIIDPEGRHLAESTVARIILTRSIACTPGLLLLSDNLSMFNKSTKDRILEKLVDRSMPWTLVMISNSKDVAQLCDRIVILDNGEIKDEILNDNKSDQLAEQGNIFN